VGQVELAGRRPWFTRQAQVYPPGPGL